ncbi:MAG: hypothetical protein E6Q97_02860 [Desulfurellales bacterium]|nr:MAG: hypothetical protein E6Q97_02860 [Desulfurellales bacterium]
MILGRLPERHDRRTLHLRDFVSLKDARPAAPLAVRHTRKLANPPPAFGNDRWGCCTVAAQAALIYCWDSYTQGARPLPIDDRVVLERYAGISGWVGDAATDRGAFMLDALKAWKRDGLADRPLTAYLRVAATDHWRIRYALAHGGGVYVGADLPKSAQREPVWQLTTDKPGTWGGHAMACVGYDRYYYEFATWGAYKSCSIAWWDKYVDEVWVAISPAWFGADTSPLGFDAAGLQRAIQSL